jgi:hypothetical protein
MSRIAPPRIAVLGAGPIGVEAALYAVSLGLPVQVYERGQVGDNLRQWGHVRLFSPFGTNTTPLGRATLRADSPRSKLPGDADILTGHEHLAAYLEPLAASPLLRGCFVPTTTVVQVGRRGYLKGEGVGDAKRGQQPFRLLLRDGAGKESVEEAEIVLDCTGCYGNPRHLGDGGIPALGETAARGAISWGVEDILGKRSDHFADRTTLVVGGGFSAATSVVLLAALAQEHSSTWIVWLARSQGTTPIRRVVNDPLRERDLLAGKANMLATRGEGHVEYHSQARVTSLEQNKDGFAVAATVAGQEKSWQVDRVIGNVGYEPDNRIYRELQIHECYVSMGPMGLAAALMKHAGGDCLSIPNQGANTLKNPEPNYYILGAKSYGRNSNFLLETGFGQVREVFTLIANKANLDLYKAAKG